MLERVRQFWIDGVLARKLQGAGAIDLDRRVLSDAVEHPWERVLELPSQESEIIPAEKPLIQVFDDVSRALLILGGAGSGKTTTILKLAADLVTVAENDPGAPVPVVLNLSSWTLSRGSFADWIVAELKAKYYVPERMSRSWLESHRLLPILDGLDEVGEDRRAACVTALNSFVEDIGVPGLLISSRFDEYTSLPVRLKLCGAVKLQPLTSQQVERFLSSDDRLAALREAVQEDADLRELAQNPLMLNVMSSAYRDLPAHLLMSHGDGTHGNRFTHIFETYIKRVFERRGRAEQPYPPELTTAWLSWLAERMHRHAQSVFLIEQLQPSWLNDGGERRLYVISSRLIGGMALGLIFGLILDLTAGLFFGVGLSQLLDLAFGIWFGFVFGLLGGVMVALLEGVRLKRGGRLIKAASTARLQPALDATLYTVLLGAAGGLVVGLIDGAESVGFGLLLGSVFGLFFGLRNGTSTIDQDIRTVEALVWSWMSARKGARRGALTGCAAGLLIGVLMAGGDVGFTTIFSLILAATFAMIGGITGALFTGLRSTILKTKTVPNQGIRLSARNAALGGTIVGAAGAVFLALSSGAIWGFTTGLAAGMIGGVFLGLLAALWFGGLDIVQHGTVRLILHATVRVPVNIAHFLDYGVRLAFLQRVGGGYIFMHRGLQEHFAERHPSTESDYNRELHEAGTGASVER